MIPPDLVANWWEYHRRSAGTRPERKALSLGEPAEVLWAYDYVNEQVWDGSPDAVGVLVALNDGAPAEDDGMKVGGRLARMANASPVDVGAFGLLTAS